MIDLHSHLSAQIVLLGQEMSLRGWLFQELVTGSLSSEKIKFRNCSTPIRCGSGCVLVATPTETRPLIIAYIKKQENPEGILSGFLLADAKLSDEVI